MRKVPLYIKIAVPLAGLVVLAAGLFVVAAIGKAWWGQPFPMFRVASTQPIEFPHTVHAGQMGIDCQFCHRTVGEDRAATIPSVEQCMICHKVVDNGSPELAKLRNAFANNEPINWVRVNRLPDHVEFTHDSHIQFFSKQNNIPPSQVCSICHGDVKTMTVDVQVRNLKMRDCVDCHREGYLSYLTSESKATVLEAVKNGTMAPPPTDCFQCHY